MKKFLDNLFGVDKATRASTKFQISYSWYFAFVITGVIIAGFFTGAITALNIVEVILVVSGLIASIIGVNTYRIVRENVQSIQTKVNTVDEYDINKQP